MTIVEFAVLGLAAWRITRLVLYERGPAGLFTWFRSKIGVEHNDEGEPTTYPDSELGRLVACLDCGSVWAGLGLVGLYLLSPWVATLVALPFALSAAAIVIGRWIDGKSQH